MATGICPFCGKRVDKFIMYRGDIVGCRYCGIHTKQTNADRIRSMSDEELAEWFLRDPFIGSFAFCPPGTKDGEDCPTSPCELCWLEWLREEVEE